MNKNELQVTMCLTSMPNKSYGGQRKKRKFGQRSPGSSLKLSRAAYEHP